MQPARSSHHFENSFEKKNRFETAELGSWASLRRPRSGRQSQVLQSSRLSCGPATTIPGARQDPSSPDSPEAPDHAYPLRLREAPPPASGETGAGRAERLVAPARRPRGAASLLSKRLAGTVGGRAVAVWSAGQQRAPSSLGLAVAPQLSREQRRKSWPSSSEDQNDLLYCKVLTLDIDENLHKPAYLSATEELSRFLQVEMFKYVFRTLMGETVALSHF
ncbi:uncharacterized protein LOC119864453 isoform X1 [Canis lupus familiaris]|uniref:uncharacterized protein LOC119864453 isoform X1 n=1 Tax=Canis lupus familiaris TaxID=9615 RepID=UPI0018F7E0C3|nr:uncharacterized protein LOC119864453 isoform X1 [Canis lupus familiaris]